MKNSFASIELCFPLHPGSELLSGARDVVARQPEKSTLDARWRATRKLAKLLLSNLDKAERGCWEYFDDDATVKSMWDDWSKAVDTRTGARAEALPVDPYRGGEPRYLTVTAAYLLVRGSPSDAEFRGASIVTPKNLWKRQTFSTMLNAMRKTSFASVRADTLYLIPREEDWGLTATDLSDPKFAYLRPIEE